VDENDKMVDRISFFTLIDQNQLSGQDSRSCDHQGEIFLQTVRIPVKDKNMKMVLTIAVCCLLVANADAQNVKPYWVIETNSNNKANTILRIYDVQNVLIHEVTINGKSLNILKRKDRKRINKKVKDILSQEVMASKKK
jgi:hypothetical protein